MNTYKCPHCGGKTRKAGYNNSGSPRFLCLKCGKRSTPGNTIGLKTGKTCPHCGSDNNKFGGKLRSGKQRYFCRACGKSFSDNTLVKDYSNMVCIKCGSSNIRKSGFNKNGTQRYICKDCNYKFTPERKPLPPPNYHEVTCPHCSCTKATKAGRAGNNKQYYKCIQCGHKFLLDGVYKHLTEEQIKQIQELLRQGMTKRAIAEQLKLSLKTVYKFTNDMELVWQKRRTYQRNIKIKKEKQIYIDSLKEKWYNNIEKYKAEIPIEFTEKYDALNTMFLATTMTKLSYRTEVRQMLKDLKFAMKPLEQDHKQERWSAIGIDVLNGLSIEKIANKYNCSKSVVYKIAESLYPTEDITDEQKEMIIKYGVHLRVPINYLAEYVPCSEHKCREVIKEFYEN